MISLCIPTMDRFDSFLGDYLQHYVKYLQDGLIEEINICDENGNDYDKIIALYKDIHRFNVYKNDTVLGVFKNKQMVCSKATCEYVALIDSDNFCDASYFIKAKEYIQNRNLSKYCVLSPSFAKPAFDFRRYQLITKQTMKYYIQNQLSHILLNTGNYIINKHLIDNVVYDESLCPYISACDVMYYNLLLFQQFDAFEFHIVPGMEYDHVQHGDSIYLKTRHLCKECYEHFVLPSYYRLS